MEGHFRHNSLFVGPADRAAVNDGRADYVPIFLHQIPRLFRDGIVPLDVAMVHGLASRRARVHEPRRRDAGLEGGLPARAKKVIVQVNEQMPRVLGDSFIHVSRVDAIVEHTEPLPTLAAQAGRRDVEQAIGEHIVELIEPGCHDPDGDRRHPGRGLRGARRPLDLGIHTEMISDGAMQAIERGVVTGNQKTLHPGKVVITFALGSDELYEFLDNNPFIEAHPVDYVNDPFIVSQNDNMVAINSAIEVDLTGQVCSRLDRLLHLLRIRRAGRLHPRRGALEGRQADHRHARRPPSGASSRGSCPSSSRGPAS